MPIPVAARAKAWVYGSYFARIATSNPTGDMYVSRLWLLCVLSSDVCEGANNRPEESHQVSCFQGDRVTS
jgi:hypothetical protein